MTDETNIPAVEHEAAAPAPLPLLHADAIDAAPMLAQLAAHEDAWTAKFDDGDITAKEFRAGLNAITDRKDAIKWEKQKADLAREMSDGQRHNQWAGAVKDFMSTTGKQVAKSYPAMVALDAAVKKAHADPANRGLSDKAILSKAHRMFRDDLQTAFGPSETSMGGGVDHASLGRLGPIELEDALLAMTAQERDAYLA
jgi:hypothetical protein